MKYHYSIYRNKALTWQFSLSAKNDKDADKVGLSAFKKWLADEKIYEGKKFKKNEYEIRKCTLTAFIKSLEFRGKHI